MIPEHKHLIVRAGVEAPPTQYSQFYIVEWMQELIENIGMKALAGPTCKYVNVEGNKGITCVAIIETSHIAFHVWEEQDPALIQLDVYTCGPFDPVKVFEALKQFSPITMEWKYLDRETDLNVIDVGKWFEGWPEPKMKYDYKNLLRR